MKLKTIVEKATTENTPEILKHIVSPPERNPGQAGRPKKDELIILADQVAKQKEYYLKNAFELFLTNMIGVIPIVCKTDCKYESACYLEEDARPRTTRHPESGLRCSIEWNAIMIAFYGYITELEIDQTKPTEVQTAADLAGIQVKKRRIHIEMNEDGFSIENGMGVTRAGEAVLNKQKHPLWDVLEKLEKRESDILKQFSQTRAQQQAVLRELNKSNKKSIDEWISTYEED